MSCRIPLNFILDRLSILRLKSERTDSDVSAETVFYTDALNEYLCDNVCIDPIWLEKLYEINGMVWDLEFDIRRGANGLMTLEEIGKRSIAIRNLNKIRVQICNEIASTTGSGFLDIKMNHASCDTAVEIVAAVKV